MGYYKNLSIERSTRSRGGARSTGANTVKLQGLEELQRKLYKLSKFCSSTDKAALEIHKRHARNLSRKLKRRIKPADKDITVYDKGKPRLVVEKGTYKRSIGYWKYKRSGVNHIYSIGPRTGRKVPDKRDAWFQLIVEQDKQYIEGNNRHANLITAFLQANIPELERKLIADYKKHLKKSAK